jgi:hypothetical protein
LEGVDTLSLDIPFARNSCAFKELVAFSSTSNLVLGDSEYPPEPVRIGSLGDPKLLLARDWPVTGGSSIVVPDPVVENGENTTGEMETIASIKTASRIPLSSNCRL